MNFVPCSYISFPIPGIGYAKAMLVVTLDFNLIYSFGSNISL